ncbi:MAG TPA: malto-oligosyltrehalose synthase [Candidatus Binatia bacterium]|nr:malto-oligosyltrehalose synthase [Candidatus Binatia bacterium]
MRDVLVRDHVERRATYRLQLRPGFGFDAAAEVAGYLSALGASHLYSSPSLQAASGSTHGYDVIDHGRVSAELGGQAAHARLARELGRHGLGHVVDVVPNHMAIPGAENPWWWDVLEHGPASRYAAFFDVDWDPPEAHFRNVVLLPVLGDHYGRVLEASQIRLERQGTAVRVRYYDHAFPVSPRTLDGIVRRAAEIARDDDLRKIADALGELPEATATDFPSVHRRQLEWEHLRGRLGLLLDEKPSVGRALDAAIDEVNRDVETLHALLERQNYRLAFWRAAARDLGYRRFFDINSLVGLRVEAEPVFDATHALVLRWVGEGLVDGLRIDHVDGLCDPEVYLRRLAERAPEAWIVVEKILEPGEELRETWPVAGTTGYDFIARAGGLFVDPDGERPLTECYERFLGEPRDWHALARDKKLLAMSELLGSDLNRLTALLVRICEGHRRHRDYTRHELHEALRELLACFPVYRTYVAPAAERVTDEDRRWIAQATEAAKRHRTDLDPELFEFLRAILELRERGALEGELVVRFQQLSGPAMAKGVEDTAFYAYHRLISLCEVGGDPSQFGIDVEQFHRECARAARRTPEALLALSTHDTKRSADVRARLHLLSEIPDAWRDAVFSWAEHNRRYRRDAGPDPNAEYLLYQTLVGAWPIESERVQRFMEKACREAKEHTSWTRQNAEYEAAVRRFVSDILSDVWFRRALARFVAPLVEPGRRSSLAQTLLQLTAPGVPDVYQGNELWDLSLVDPDNRRPVDFELRRRLLEELRDARVEDVLARSDEGLPKLWLVSRALDLRRRRPDLFAPTAEYRPIQATGARAGHVVAFQRGGGAIAIAPRLLLRLGGDWEDTRVRVPRGTWRDVLTGDVVEGDAVEMARLVARFPVCLLERASEAR